MEYWSFSGTSMTFAPMILEISGYRRYDCAGTSTSSPSSSSVFAMLSSTLPAPWPRLTQVESATPNLSASSSLSLM